MRWLIWALSVACLTTGAVLSISLFVSDSALPERSAGRAQYNDENPGSHYADPPPGDRHSAPPDAQKKKSPTTDRSTAHTPRLSHEQGGDATENSQEAPKRSGSGSSPPVSEGSLPGARAPARELSVMQPPLPYSQVVDNASAGQFSAEGWRQSAAAANAAHHYYGENYSYVEPSKVGAPALFRMNIPATGYYTVYARWPALKGNNPATHIGISTTSGIKWTKVDQRTDGGMWVRLGAFEMEAGTRYPVQISGYRAKGRVVADAVMVVRGTQVAPPHTTGDETVEGAAKADQIVERARSQIGTPYVHSPPGPCEAHRSEDCSCFTSLVFGELGIKLPDDPVEQWGYGQEVAKPELRPGDLVFFKEAGASNPITHVAIYSGRGNIIHASSYWGEVVERPMSSVNGYYGARRLVQY